MTKPDSREKTGNFCQTRRFAMPMTAEELALERERRAQQQRVDALNIASKHFPSTQADTVVKAATEFHKFLTGI